MKERSMAHRDTSTLFSIDAKCKNSVGEPNFAIASVTRGKKVIVGINESFEVGDHDFNKISIIPDAVFVQKIPENKEQGGKDFQNSWFSGKVFYSFKNMVTQGSSALRDLKEVAKILKSQHISASQFYAISDGGGDQRVDYLSVKKALIGMFLVRDLDELIIYRTTAGHSYRNPVERIHAIANLELQSVRMMRKKMSPDVENLVKNCNFNNEELRKATKHHSGLKKALDESLSVPIDILKSVFSQLFLKNEKFKIFVPASAEDLAKYKLKDEIFDKSIADLEKKESLQVHPNITNFLNTPCTSRTYYFRIFKCESDDCKFHLPVRGGPIEKFGDPVPYQDDNENKHCCLGDDPEERYMPSKLENPVKRKHGLPFSPTAQTALNFGMTMNYTECRKLRLIYSKSKLKPKEVNELKRSFNGFQYVCGSSFQEISIDNRSSTNLNKVLS